SASIISYVASARGCAAATRSHNAGVANVRAVKIGIATRIAVRNAPGAHRIVDGGTRRQRQVGSQRVVAAIPAVAIGSVIASIKTGLTAADALDRVIVVVPILRDLPRRAAGQKDDNRIGHQSAPAALAAASSLSAFTACPAARSSTSAFSI